MIKTIAPSLVSGALNMVSSARQYSRQKELLKKQQEYQTQERLSSQQWQQRMYDLQNRYNSPVAVMARLKEAGLSPDMYYSGAGNVAASVPGSTAGGAPSVPIPAGESSMIQGANALGDTALKAAQIANLKSEEELNKQKSKTEAQITLLTGEQVVLTNKQIATEEGKAQEIQANINQSIEMAKKLSAETRLTEQQLKEMISTFPDRFNTIVYQNRSLLKKIDIDEETLRYLGRQMEANIKNINSRTQLNILQAIDFQGMLKARQKFRDENQNKYYDLLVNYLVATQKGNVGMIQHTLDQAYNYDDIKAVVSIANGITSAIGNLY